MSFDDLNRFGIDLETIIYRTFQPFLCPGIGSDKTIRTAVLVDAASCNHPINMVPISQSVLQTLQYHYSNSFAGNKTIGSRIKAIALPFGRKHSSAIRDLVETGSCLYIDAAGQGHLRFP